MYETGFDQNICWFRHISSCLSSIFSSMSGLRGGDLTSAQPDPHSALHADNAMLTHAVHDVKCSNESEESVVLC